MVSIFANDVASTSSWRQQSKHCIHYTARTDPWRTMLLLLLLLLVVVVLLLVVLVGLHRCHVLLLLLRMVLMVVVQLR